MRVAPRRRGGGGGGEEAADGEVGRARGCTICQRLEPRRRGGVGEKEADGEEGRARAREVATTARRADGGRGGEASIGMAARCGWGRDERGAWGRGGINGISRCMGGETRLITPGPRSAATIEGAGFVGDGEYGRTASGYAESVVPWKERKAPGDGGGLGRVRREGKESAW